MTDMPQPRNTKCTQRVKRHLQVHLTVRLITDLEQRTKSQSANRFICIRPRGSISV